MRLNNKLAIVMLAGAISICSAYGDDNVSANHIDAAGRAQVISRLEKELQARYVFPDVATKVVHELNTKEANGAYAATDNAVSFAETLDHDLKNVSNDEHLGVRFKPDFNNTADAGMPTAKEVQVARLEVVRSGFGIARVDRLPGNVGYIDLREFDPVEFSAPAYTAALSLLSGTDALILDLRRNDGGDPESVAFLLSHLFAEGDDRHLNDVYDRASNSTRQFWTTESVDKRYVNPVYVLISSNTFSAGEECAYDLREQKRATLIGETTRGGANPGSNVDIGNQLVAFIPFARAINPMTHTNWEHVGVKPDIDVAASKAERTAYAMALKALISANNDSEQKTDLEKILLQTESQTDVSSDTLFPH